MPCVTRNKPIGVFPISTQSNCLTLFKGEMPSIEDLAETIDQLQKRPGRIAGLSDRKLGFFQLRILGWSWDAEQVRELEDRRALSLGVGVDRIRPHVRIILDEIVQNVVRLP